VIIGLLILAQLVNEMNQPQSSRNIAKHRKIAVSFRDLQLLQIFQIGLTVFRQILTNTIPYEHRTNSYFSPSIEFEFQFVLIFFLSISL